MYKDTELTFNQKHQSPLCTSVLVPLIVEIFHHDPTKKIHFTQAKLLIRHDKLFLSHFNA